MKNFYINIGSYLPQESFQRELILNIYKNDCRVLALIAKDLIQAELKEINLDGARIRAVKPGNGISFKRSIAMGGRRDSEDNAVDQTTHWIIVDSYTLEQEILNVSVVSQDEVREITDRLGTDRLSARQFALNFR